MSFTHDTSKNKKGSTLLENIAKLYVNPAIVALPSGVEGL